MILMFLFPNVVHTFPITWRTHHHPQNVAPKFKFWHTMSPEEQAERLRFRKRASKRGWSK
jgi:hypothetical protein